MTTDHLHDDEAIDRAAIQSFRDEVGDRATSLPPVAIVIAAFNEEGAIGPVVETLPTRIAGLDAATIVVSEEVGLSVHPPTKLGRLFVDALGSVNQAVAAIADRAVLVVAGRIVELRTLEL